MRIEHILAKALILFYKLLKRESDASAKSEKATRAPLPGNPLPSFGRMLFI